MFAKILCLKRTPPLQKYLDPTLRRHLLGLLASFHLITHGLYFSFVAIIIQWHYVAAAIFVVAIHLTLQ